MSRKTDSNNPADWLAIAAQEIEGVRMLAKHECAHEMCRSKLSEIVEKVMKAELIRSGWPLLKTHDLEHLLGELTSRGSDLAERFQPLSDDLAEAYFIDRYPGFDLEDPDWPKLRGQLEAIAQLLEAVKARLAGS